MKGGDLTSAATSASAAPAAPPRPNNLAILRDVRRPRGRLIQSARPRCLLSNYFPVRQGGRDVLQRPPFFRAPLPEPPPPPTQKRTWGARPGEGASLPSGLALTLSIGPIGPGESAIKRRYSVKSPPFPPAALISLGALTSRLPLARAEVRPCLPGVSY